MTHIVQPIFRIVTLRGNDESVTFPFAHSPSIPPGIGIFGKSDVVRTDFAIVVSPVERLEYLPGCLNKLKRPAIDVHIPRIAQGVASAHRGISYSRNKG